MSEEVLERDVRSPRNLDTLTTDEFLALLGQRIRQHRTDKRMSRKKLAETSGVSERYLAQLEAGQGNMSIALLRKVTTAIELPLNVLLAETEAKPAVEASGHAARPAVAEYS